MNYKTYKRKRLFLLLFCILSFIAGGINGFLGTGGGIIFIFMLSLLTKNEQRDNFAISLCTTMFISLFGLLAYYKGGNIDFKILSTVGPFAVIGGIVGALIMDKIKVKWLNVIFAFLMIYSGFCMLKR